MEMYIEAAIKIDARRIALFETSFSSVLAVVGRLIDDWSSRYSNVGLNLLYEYSN